MPKRFHKKPHNPGPEPEVGGFTPPIVLEDSEGIKRFSQTRAVASTSDNFMNDYISKNPDLVEDDKNAGELKTQEEKQTEANNFVNHIAEIPPAIGQGLLKAGQEIGNFAVDLADWTENFGSEIGIGSGELIQEDDRLSFADDPSFVFQPQTNTGKIVSSIAQFLAPAGALGKMSKGVKAVTKLGKFAKAGAIGAAVDFAAFDPKEERLSNMIQSSPALRNPVTQYLAANPKDTRAEGRFKNAIEGLGIGTAAEGLFLGLKAMRHNRVMNSMFKDGESVMAKADAGELDLFGEGVEGADEAIVKIKAEVKAERATQQIVEPPPIPEELISVVKTKEGEAAKILRGMEDVTPEGKAININLENIETTADVKKVIKTMSETFKTEIDEARRGIITEKESRKLADDIGMSFDDLMKRKEGEAFKAEDVIGTRRILNISAEQVSDIAKKITGGDDSRQTQALFIQAIDRHRLVQSRASGIAAEAGRALQAFKQGVGLDGAARNRYIDDLIKVHGGNSGLGEIAEAISRNSDTASISTLTRKSTSRKLQDVAKETFINGLLSGPYTHAFNALSNTSVIASSIVEKKFAEVFSGGALDSVAQGEAKAMFTGLMGSLKDSFDAGIKNIKTGKSEFNAVKFEFDRAISAKNFGQEGDSVWGRALDFMGSVINVPSKALEASDEVFKTANYRMEIHAQAHRKAMREQVAKGLTDEQTAKVFEDALKMPDDNIVMSAKDFARENTFTKPVGELEVRGFSPGSLDQAIKDTPAMRVIAPFTKTNLNLVEYSLNRTPFAKGILADIKAGGVRGDTAKGRIAMGMSAMALATAGTVGGQVTGRGPADPKARKALEATGWKPYSLRVGDKFLPYNRLDPISSIIAISADMSEIVGSFGKDRESEAQDLAIQAGAAMANFFTPEFLMENVNDFLDAMNGDKRKVDRIVGNIGGALIPFSSGLRFIRQEVTDPVKRETRPDPNAAFPIMDKIMNGVRNTIPGLSDTLPPQKDIFGKVKTYKPWFAKNPDEDSPLEEGEEGKDLVSKEIQRMNMTGPQAFGDDETLSYLKLDMPPRFIKKSFGGQQVSVKLTPEQYDKFVDLAAGIGLQSAPDGKTLKEFLNQEISEGYPNIPGNKTDEAKILLIKEIVSNYRKAAREELLMEDADIEEQFMEGAQEKFSKITGEDIELSL